MTMFYSQSSFSTLGKIKPRTDKRVNKIFLINKEIQSGGVAKSYIYEEGLPNIRGNAQIFSHIPI
jgi:hypothetical protein